MALKVSQNVRTSAYEPFNFDADPDPGSALEKNESGSRLFL